MIRGSTALLATMAALTPHGAAAQAQGTDDVRDVAPDPDPNFEIHGTVSGTHYSLSNSQGSPDTSGNTEALSMNLVAFATPLHDDDWPYSLQPFEQRESILSVSVASGHFDTANQVGGMDRTEWWAGAGAAFDAYVKQWLAVFAGASYDYFDLHDVNVAQTIHAFSANAGVGFRHRDTRINVSVGELGEHTSGPVVPWRGRVTLSAFTVIRQRVGLTATGTLIQNGREGSLDVELFPTKATGLFVSAFAGRFEPYAEPVVATRYIGAAGFAGWFDSTTALLGQYSLTYETDPAVPQVTNGYDELSHTLLLEVYVRFQ